MQSKTKSKRTMKTLVIYSYFVHPKSVFSLRTEETVTEKIRALCKAQRIALARRANVPDRIIDRTYPDFEIARATAERAGFYAVSAQQIVASAG